MVFDRVSYIVRGSSAAKRYVCQQPFSAMHKLSFIFGVICLAAIAIVVFLFGPSKILCSASGGRWQTNSEHCMTRDCYEAGDCGDWYSPGTRCDHVKVGTSEREAYFQLGNPKRTNGDERWWNVAPTSSDEIRAVVKNGTVTEFNCP